MNDELKQKAKLRQHILILENENRRLQREMDDAEIALGENQKEIDHLYRQLKEIGTEA